MKKGINLFLSIGIDKYDVAFWKPLKNAVKDVNRLGEILMEKYGFEKIDEYLLDEKATLEAIHKLLKRPIGDCSELDSLIIYFAGHGLAWPENVGNWIPQPADRETYNWMPSSLILTYLGEIKAKHILIIHDCCYSGAFVHGQPKLAQLKLTDEQLAEKKSRIIFTAGGMTPVSDGKEGFNSPFSRSLCEVLESNKQPTLKVSRLIDDVTRTTGKRTKQVPESSEIKNTDNESGEMIFRIILPPAAEVALYEEGPEFTVPELPDEKLLIARTVTFSEHQHSIAQLMFDIEVNRVPLEEVLRKDRHIVLLGTAGSGKSYQMLKVAKLLKQNRSIAVPVYKRLNDYKGEGLDIFLSLDFSKIANTGFMLFLDGLDEIAPEHFPGTIEEIDRLANDYPLIGLVVACRTNFYEIPQQGAKGTLENFTVYYLNDITGKDILKHTSEVLQIDGEDFLAKAYLYGMSELLPNPFFLQLLFAHYMETHTLDVKRADLIERSISRSLGELAGEVRPKLNQLAFIMEMMGRNYLTPIEIGQVFAGQDLESELAGLQLFSLDTENKKWMFQHNNLQEYLAAQVLATLEFEKLMEIIAFKASGKSRIRATWLNTVSFLSNVGNEELFAKLFDWIINNDMEVVIRLEPHRLTEEQKTSVFKRIFEFYAGRGIWLSSNLFSTAELSRFAHSETTLKYLIEILKDRTGSRIAKLNAIHVLLLFDIERFADEKGNLLSVLMEMVRSSGFESGDMISVLGLIAHLKLADDKAADFIIQRYKFSRDQYLRAGMYKLLAEQDLVDKYLEVILDGLDLDNMAYGENDRDGDSLMDESFNLRRAIEKITSSDGLERFLAAIIASMQKRWTISRDNRELYPKIISNAANNFASGNGKMFELILRLYLTLFKDFDEHILEDVAKFFIATNTRKDVLLHIWRHTDRNALGWDKLTLSLVDEHTIENFVELCQSSDLDEESLNQFHKILFYKRHKFEKELTHLEELAKSKLGLTLERPKIIDWTAVQLAEAQSNFDLLFDMTALEKEIRKAFTIAGGEEINRDRLYSLMSNSYERTDEDVLQVSIDVIREFTDQHRSANLTEVVASLQSGGFYRFRIEKIKSMLSREKQISVDEGQVTFVQDWCLKKGDDQELLWFFLHRFGFKLQSPQLEELTRYANSSVDGQVGEPGSLEMLERFTPLDKLAETVLENIATDQLSIQGWISNVSYMIRKKNELGYPLFIKAMKERQNEGYKDKELLEFWFETTNDVNSLKDIIAVTGALAVKWKAIRLLKPLPGERDFLVDVLKSIMIDTGNQLYDRQEAANQLIELGDSSGFFFLADLVLGTKDPTIDFRHGFRNMVMVNSIDTIDALMKMLHLSKTPEFKRDIFNDLESVVLGALVNLGLQNEENSVIVIQNIENFMTVHAKELPNLNFLYYTIAKIRDSSAFSQTVTIEDSIKQYEEIAQK